MHAGLQKEEKKKKSDDVRRYSICVSVASVADVIKSSLASDIETCKQCSKFRLACDHWWFCVARCLCSIKSSIVLDSYRHQETMVIPPLLLHSFIDSPCTGRSGTLTALTLPRASPREINAVSF